MHQCESLDCLVIHQFRNLFPDVFPTYVPTTLPLEVIVQINFTAELRHLRVEKRAYYKSKALFSGHLLNILTLKMVNVRNTIRQSSVV